MILYYQFRALLSSVFWLCCGRHLRLNENGFWMQALFAICHVVSYIIWDCCMRSGQWPAAVNCLTCGWRMAQRELISLIKFTWTISKQHPQQTSTTLTGQRFISSVCCPARDEDSLVAWRWMKFMCTSCRFASHMPVDTHARTTLLPTI